MCVYAHVFLSDIVRVCNRDESLREHLISPPDCCVTMITPNGCHYNKWPDYCNSVWKTYWRPNKPALNGTPLRLTLWHEHNKRLLHRVLTERATEGIITYFSFMSESEGLLVYFYLIFESFICIACFQCWRENLNS